MNYTRLALVFAICSLCSIPASAASLTMLQFGSFETRAEAEKRLSEVTAKHKSEIGTLATSIREIKLPPDNLTVYRTQAGPVENRSAAQGICSKLASTGDECYIVQTAMVTPDASTSVAATQPTTTPSTLITQPTTAAIAASRITPVENIEVDTAKTLPSRDATSRAKLSSVSGNDFATSGNDFATNGAVMSSEPTTEASAPKVSRALDEAAAGQAQADSEINAATAKQVQAGKPGFWSRMNPFSTGKPAGTSVVNTAAVEAPSPMATPVGMVNTDPLPAPMPATPIAAPVIVTPIDSAASATQAAPSVPLVAPAPMANIAPPPPAPTATAALPEPMRLPPPPAPLKAQDREALSAPKTPVRPEPIDVTANPPLNANGMVNVEEAKRVPVTSTVVTPVPAYAAVPVVAKPGVALNPSATEGLKTIWAQVGPFPSNEAALNYWASYRQNNPDFPVVRVRVTSPYIQQLRGVGQSWLRVGPMSQVAFVKNLCTTLVPNDPDHSSNLRCGAVSDLGMASPLSKTPGLLPSSRYKH